MNDERKRTTWKIPTYDHKVDGVFRHKLEGRVVETKAWFWAHIATVANITVISSGLPPETNKTSVT